MTSGRVLSVASGDVARPTWRLLVSGAADGATNMAVDEAIMEAVGAGEAPGTLRFYGWQPPCLSVGYAQSLADEVDLDLCRSQGIEWVRRPTGGRAILHTDELTYSLALPADDPLVHGDVVESYRHLSRGLLAGFRRLGLAAVQSELAVAPRRGESPACFDQPSHYEITCLGRKLVGSAQVRRRHAVLQHGSIPLRGDVARIVQYLKMVENQKPILREELARRAITLSEALGAPPAAVQVIAALTAGFAEALEVHLEPGQLTDKEQERAAELRLTRYATVEWNARL
jgi:lipoyl(octanoyl) transferase